jgi:hypothetical protein
MDGLTDKTKPIVAFRNFADVPKNARDWGDLKYQISLTSVRWFKNMNCRHTDTQRWHGDVIRLVCELHFFLFFLLLSAYFYRSWHTENTIKLYNSYSLLILCTALHAVCIQTRVCLSCPQQTIRLSGLTVNSRTPFPFLWGKSPTRA